MCFTMKAKDIAGETEQPILAQYDKTNRILVDGSALITQSQIIREPSFRLDGEYPGFGDLLLAESAAGSKRTTSIRPDTCWTEFNDPNMIDRLPSVGIQAPS